MQALERAVLLENFITILFVVALSCLAMLKSINSEKLKGTISSVFSAVFIEEETEANDSFFSAFNLILFVFSVLIISILFYELSQRFSLISDTGIFIFLKFFGIVLGYFSVKWFFEFLIKILFLVKNEITFFLVSKSRSLYAISLGFFCILILTVYSSLASYFLLYGSILFLFIRFLVIIVYNKNLILSKLFYFILYICAFEIAPLFVLFKLMF